MLRILLAMPHFYKSDPASEHGFGHDAPEKRAAIVSDCVRALRLTFSTPRTYSAFVSEADGHIYVRKFPADTWNACEIDLAICTTMGEDHVLPLLDVPENWYKQVKVVLDNPRHLPFGCLQYLRQHRGEYDYYGYLEDDCKITDPMFFQKLGWFDRKMLRCLGACVQAGDGRHASVDGYYGYRRAYTARCEGAAERIRRLTESKSEIIYQPLPEDDPTQRRPDITLAVEKLGWRPNISADEGLKHTIAYFQAFQS